VRSIRVFAKNLGDPYYEPTIVVHDSSDFGYKSFLHSLKISHKVTFMSVSFNDDPLASSHSTTSSTTSTWALKSSC